MFVASHADSQIYIRRTHPSAGAFLRSSESLTTARPKALYHGAFRDLRVIDRVPDRARSLR